MKLFVGTVSLLILGVLPLQAQKLMVPMQEAPVETTQGTPHWCATPHLMASPEGQAALARFTEARRTGTLPKSQASLEQFEIGQIQTFNIQKDSMWQRAEFTLSVSGSMWRAWIRSDVPDQDIITQQRLEQFRLAMDEQTPAGSYDPNLGVFPIDIEIFGNWPIYPEGSDGLIDILIYELDQGVAGFVSPSDFDPRSPDTVGNQSEIMYLDIDGFFVPGNGSIESVAAHELQHAIHLAYDTREAQFVNEGLSEYAQAANGYGVTPPVHLYGPFPEYNIDFFTWRGLNSLDYTRGSLWTGYVAERIGPEATGMITRSDRVGLEGYQEALQNAGKSVTFDELLADYHTANLINDRTIDERFGYVSQQRTGELGLLRVPASSRFDGFAGTGLVADSLIILQGGAEYLIVENVKDFKVSVDVAAQADQLEGRRKQLLVRIIGKDLDGEISMMEFNAGEQIHEMKGSFEELQIVFVHLRPESTQLRVQLNADWVQDPDREVETVGYSLENGAVRNGAILAFAVDPLGRGAQATRFEPPPGSVLDRVTMATYYFSQFGNGGQPSDAPRDFRFVIWESNGLGQPGDEIYSQEMDDPLPYIPVFSDAYNWFDLDLDPVLGKSLGALPDTIFIGVENVGTDDNYLVVWPSNFSGSPAIETGFIRLVDQQGLSSWVPLWDVVIGGGGLGERPLNRTALPVKARFVTDNRAVAIESTGEIPSQIGLDQNYPNPFNPSTRIQFALPEATEVSLDVFDVTGRLVTSLVDGRQAAGSYSVTLDATNWTSGVYFYRLTAGEQQVQKRMVLVK